VVKRRRDRGRPGLAESFANRALAVAIVVGGLVTSGWGAWHFNDPPLPARKNGIGYVQYETSGQLRAIFGGLAAVGFGITVWRLGIASTRPKR
jgi:hypothetical protein